MIRGCGGTVLFRFVACARRRIPRGRRSTSSGRRSPKHPYTGPVAILTGGSDVSAGETFVQALLNRPRTVRIGQNTQGVFSDILERHLPNGWLFGLPDEEFLTRTGRTFDGTGIPPRIRTPVFTAAEVRHDRDSAFDTAMMLLSR